MLSVSSFYFNSIKVQLKLVVFAATAFLSVLFQFHKGTIKTCKAL